MKLTNKDILKGKDSGNGFGLYFHTARGPEFWLETQAPYDFAKAVDDSVIEIANQLKWDAKKLHAFMDSRDGRHCGDALTFLNQKDQTLSQRSIAKVILSFMSAFSEESK